MTGAGTAAGADGPSLRELEIFRVLADAHTITQAATDLHFELAARLRDEIGDLKKELRQMTAATH